MITRIKNLFVSVGVEPFEPAITVARQFIEDHGDMLIHAVLDTPDEISVPWVQVGDFTFHLCALPVSAPWPTRTREEAKAAGNNKYWPGKICRNGHLSMRYTHSGICCRCHALNTQAYRARKSGGVVTVKGIHPNDKASLMAYAQALRDARCGHGGGNSK